MCTHYTTHLRSNTASSNHQYAGNPFHVNQAEVCREVLEHVRTSKTMLLHGVLCSGLFNAAGQLFMDRVWSGLVESFLNLMLF